MPLDTQKHVAELTELTELASAFQNISNRAQTSKLKAVWASKKAIAEALIIALHCHRHWEPKVIKTFYKMTEELSDITGLLIDHTHSPEGKQFWTNQTVSLLGLADHLSDRLVTKKQTLSAHAFKN